MTRNLGVTLKCCGLLQEVKITEAGIVARDPNEVKRNVVCPKCGTLVILSFEKCDSEMRVEKETIN